MTHQARQFAFFGPTAVAVHNDAYVARDNIQSLMIPFRLISDQEIGNQEIRI
jgi:hypothetical protein